MMHEFGLPGSCRYTLLQIALLTEKRKSTRRPFTMRELPSYLKPTQDRILRCGPVHGVSSVSVFDGHGVEGHHVATDAHTMVERWIHANAQQLHSLSHDARSELIRQLFVEINTHCRTQMMSRGQNRTIDQAGVVRELDGSPTRGGTTATITFMFMKDEKKIVHTANVGDSTGYILVTRPDGTTECITTTTAHSANNIAEYQHIQRVGGSCRFVYTNNEAKSVDWLPVFSGSADNAVKEPIPSTAFSTNAKGNLSTYMESSISTSIIDMMRLAITRAIGNFYAPKCYNRVPDQSIHEFDENCELFVCVASDGLWDVVPNDELVLRELKQNLQSNASIQQTVEKYAFDGACLFGPSSCDDISAVVATY